MDGLAKYLSAGYSPLFLGWARYAVACLIVLPIAAALHGRASFPPSARGSHILRTLFLVASMTLYFLALARIPLATAISAFFVGPIVAVVLSVFMLKERMTAPKLMSLVLGFAGALVILRPGATIDPGILLAFGSGLCFAFYLIATRRRRRHSDPVRTLAFQCVVGTLLLTPQALVAWSMPALERSRLLRRTGHVLGVQPHAVDRRLPARRRLDAGAARLYRTDRRRLIGYLAFDEIPGGPTIIGAALIVLGGVILVRRRPQDAEAQAESGAG